MISGGVGREGGMTDIGLNWSNQTSMDAISQGNMVMLL